MKKEFVIRGQTANTKTEVLNFSGYKPGYAFKIVEFKLYPAILDTVYELMGSITAAKYYANPAIPNFNQEGLIATAFLTNNDNPHLASANLNSIVNDTYLITQDLILAVNEGDGSSATHINWHCRFESVKMSGPEEAVANYKQFTITDE